MKRIFGIFLLILLLAAGSIAQDSGWPRQMTKQGAKLIYYQPQIDEWKNYRQLDARMAISLTPVNGEPVVGVLSLRMQTTTDMDSHTVVLSNLKITNTSFPSLDPAAAAQMDQLVRTFLTPGRTISMSLDRLVASVNKPKTPPAVPVKSDAPTIFVSYEPAILLSIDGEPIRTAIKKTKLEFVVNSNWPLFFDKSTSRYFLFTGKQWATSNILNGGWAQTSTLPKDMAKVSENPNWANLKAFIPPPPAGAAQPPRVFYSNGPAELIIFKGQPVYSPIPSTRLVYATNTDSTLFVNSPTNTYYYLTAGRWFSAASLEGPWRFATADLPPDFKLIPAGSPAGRVLASVPGTPEAADAVLLAQIPTTVVVNSAEAAKQVKVAYYGEPQFKPIEGTSLQYAVNTQDKVIKVGDLYYLCFQGVWFMSATPQGPWQTAQSVPQAIYTIPPSSPVYNVTYVTQQPTSNDNVEASYTAGYLGAFAMGTAVGVIIADGTGYYYPPYVGWYGAYPVYYPYPGTYGAAGSWYNPYSGRYGYGGAAYGPYGGARWGSSYNPYTGTYARGATAYGPYGSRSAGQAYNPYTGAYGATRQGSNAYSQWGSSVVSRGGQTAYTQHVTSARGTAGSVQTSSGGKAVGATGAYGSGFAGKTGSGDMYAGKDGNVYRNTGTGWQKYDNGSWNTVDKPTAATQSARPSGTSSFQKPAGGSEFQGLNQESQNRQRGAAQSQRFENAQRSGGFRSGGMRSSGGGFRRR